MLLAIGESSLVACCARKSARRSCRRDAVGWGLGFYGPPFYLHAVHESRGWSLNVVSTVSRSTFCGAIVIANLPRLYRRFGLARVTKAGSLALAIGVAGWALAQEPWQLFVATLFSGGGWVTMGAAAVNAIVAPWFVRKRPAALASAYNGSSIGGVVFSPLWVAAIGLLGFPSAAIAIGVVVVATIGFWPISTIQKRRNRWGCIRTAMHRMPRPRPYRCRRRLSRCRAPGSGGTGACLRLRRAWRLACSRRSGFWRTFSPFWCRRLARNWRDLPLAALRPLRYWAGPWSAG